LKFPPSFISKKIQTGFSELPAKFYPAKVQKIFQFCYEKIGKN
jgi:hypothetical protein